TGHNQVGIVEGGPKGMGQRVPQFSALMDRARRLGRDMTRNSTGEGKLPKQALHAFFILTHIRIYFAVGALEIDVRHDRWTAMTRPADKDHIQVVPFDDPIEMDIDEIQSRCRSPMAQ